VKPLEFEMKRYEYHRAIEEDFFSKYQVVDTKQHVVKRGDQIWALANKRYEIPVWLLYRANETQNISQLHPGMKLEIPIVRMTN